MPAAARKARRLNADWHASHRMLPKATLEQRIEWHVAHAAACACRAMPASIVAALKERGRSLPRPPR